MNLQSLDSAVSAPRLHYFSFNKNQQDLNKLTGLCMLWVGHTLLSSVGLSARSRRGTKIESDTSEENGL